jgi:hypothetical protein
MGKMKTNSQIRGRALGLLNYRRPMGFSIFSAKRRSKTSAGEDSVAGYELFELRGVQSSSDDDVSKVIGTIPNEDI